MKRWWLLFLLLAVSPAFAAPTLQQLQDKIRAQREAIHSGEVNQATLQKFLEESDRMFARLHGKVRTLTGKVSLLRKTKKRLLAKVRKGEAQVEALRQGANKAALPILAVGEGGLLKVLFGRAGFGEIVLADLAMKNWFGSAAAKVRQFAAAAERAQAARRQLDKQLIVLHREQKLLKQQQAMLRATRKGKSQLLAGLRNRLSLYRQTLAGLQQEKARLRQLLQRQVKKGMPSRMPPERTALAPVKVQRIRGFGPYRDQATGLKLESTGILFAAKPGTPVLATASGKVVFADWFRGYGWLVILAHNGGYFSLYAHCQELAVKEGQMVTAGQRLADSGDSGSLDGPSIYFEVRKGTQPVNPVKWLAGR